MALNDPDHREKLRLLVRERRLKRGMTVGDAARKLGVTTRDWENLEGKGTGLGAAGFLILLIRNKFLQERELLEDEED